MHHPCTAMPNALRALGTTAAVAGAASLLIGLAGCGSGEEEQDQDSAQAAPEEVANKLDEAQLAQFDDVEVDPEQSESGTYAELGSTSQAAELREGTELDKPDCKNAVDPWGQLSEVRDAPASKATYPREAGPITHTLIEVSEDAAEEAVNTEPPAECESYTATLEDGTTTAYTIRDLDMETVGDASRAFVVDAESEGESVHMYNLIYHNGDHLAAVSALGTEDEATYTETLQEFAQNAVEREEEILG